MHTHSCASGLCTWPLQPAIALALLGLQLFSAPSSAQPPAGALLPSDTGLRSRIVCAWAVCPSPGAQGEVVHKEP